MANNPLQSSGTISFSDINIELGRSSTATIGLDNAENGDYGCIQHCQGSFPLAANPAAISEWYGYNHTLKATLDGNQWDGPYSTIAAACASVIITGAQFYFYSPTGGWYINDSLGPCCRNCVADGYYKKGSAFEYVNIVSCTGTVTACPATTTTTTAAPCVCNTFTNECSSTCPNTPSGFCITNADCF
jgi:hypothetical protein